MERSRSIRSALSRHAASLALAAALAVTGLSFGAAPAIADDGLPNGTSGRVHYDHYRDRGGDRHHWRHDDRRSHRFHDRRDGYRHGKRSTSGTYSGNVSAYDQPGHGTYFYVERDGYRDDRREDRRVRSGPKVISPGGGVSPCGNPGGVCIIRPGD